MVVPAGIVYPSMKGPMIIPGRTVIGVRHVQQAGRGDRQFELLLFPSHRPNLPKFVRSPILGKASLFDKTSVGVQFRRELLGLPVVKLCGVT